MFCYIAFVGFVHDHRQIIGQAFGLLLPVFKKGTALNPIAGLTRGQAYFQGRSIIRTSQMNFGVPSASGFSDGLWAVFFSEPRGYLDGP